jgi:hypothetical protein
LVPSCWRFVELEGILPGFPPGGGIVELEGILPGFPPGGSIVELEGILPGFPPAGGIVELGGKLTELLPEFSPVGVTVELDSLLSDALLFVHPDITTTDISSKPITKKLIFFIELPRPLFNLSSEIIGLGIFLPDDLGFKENIRFKFCSLTTVL